MNKALPPQTAEDYILLVRQLGAIINIAMDHVEKSDARESSILEFIAHNIETIACLRGNSRIYDETRPEGLATYQNEMYQIEDALRMKLVSLGYHPTTLV